MKRNIQKLLNEVDATNKRQDMKAFNEACQRLGEEIYRRSLRKNVYKIRVENPEIACD